MTSIARYRAIDIKRSRRHEVHSPIPSSTCREDFDVAADLATVAGRRRRRRAPETLPRAARLDAAQRRVPRLHERAHARRSRDRARLAARHGEELGAPRPRQLERVSRAMRYDDRAIARRIGPRVRARHAARPRASALRARARRVAAGAARRARVGAAARTARASRAGRRAAAARAGRGSKRRSARARASTARRRALARARRGPRGARASCSAALYLGQGPRIEQAQYVAVIADQTTAPCGCCKRSPRSCASSTINERPETGRQFVRALDAARRRRAAGVARAASGHRQLRRCRSTRRRSPCSRRPRRSP